MARRGYGKGKKAKPLKPKKSTEPPNPPEPTEPPKPAFSRNTTSAEYLEALKELDMCDGDAVWEARRHDRGNGEGIFLGQDESHYYLLWRMCDPCKTKDNNVDDDSNYSACVELRSFRSNPETRLKVPRFVFMLGYLAAANKPHTLDRPKVRSWVVVMDVVDKSVWLMVEPHDIDRPTLEGQVYVEKLPVGRPPMLAAFDIVQILAPGALFTTGPRAWPADESQRIPDASLPRNEIEVTFDNGDKVRACSETMFDRVMMRTAQSCTMVPYRIASHDDQVWPAVTRQKSYRQEDGHDSNDYSIDDHRCLCEDCWSD